MGYLCPHLLASMLDIKELFDIDRWKFLHGDDSKAIPPGTALLDGLSRIPTPSERCRAWRKFPDPAGVETLRAVACRAEASFLRWEHSLSCCAGVIAESSSALSLCRAEFNDHCTTATTVRELLPRVGIVGGFSHSRGVRRKCSKKPCFFCAQRQALESAAARANGEPSNSSSSSARSQSGNEADASSFTDSDSGFCVSPVSPTTFCGQPGRYGDSPRLREDLPTSGGEATVAGTIRLRRHRAQTRCRRSYRARGQAVYKHHRVAAPPAVAQSTTTWFERHTEDPRQRLDLGESTQPSTRDVRGSGPTDFHFGGAETGASHQCDLTSQNTGSALQVSPKKTGVVQQVPFGDSARQPSLSKNQANQSSLDSVSHAGSTSHEGESNDVSGLEAPMQDMAPMEAFTSAAARFAADFGPMDTPASTERLSKNSSVKGGGSRRANSSVDFASNCMWLRTRASSAGSGKLLSATPIAEDVAVNDPVLDVVDAVENSKLQVFRWNAITRRYFWPFGFAVKPCASSWRLLFLAFRLWPRRRARPAMVVHQPVSPSAKYFR